jgi:hypothetical protein
MLEEIISTIILTPLDELLMWLGLKNGFSVGTIIIFVLAVLLIWFFRHRIMLITRFILNKIGIGG